MKQKKGWFGKKQNTEETFNQASGAQKPVTSALQAELERISAIDKLAAGPRKRAYWSILHPLVQSACVYGVGWDQEKLLSITSNDARQVFYHWGYQISPYQQGNATETQKQLMRKYGDSREELWIQYQAAVHRFEQIDRESETEQAKAWEMYMEHLETLMPPLQKQICYELARQGRAQGHIGVHARFSPFRQIGWADYEDPEYGPMEGVAFRIEEGCFFGRQPTLYYYDDDNWPGTGAEAQKNLQLIRQYSSGIGNVRLEQWAENESGSRKKKNVVVFELDPGMAKPSVELSGNPVPTKDAGYYLFVLPRSGEFHCCLGEIRNGEKICLHIDDYCMK